MVRRAFWCGATLLLVVCVLGVQTLRYSFFTVSPSNGALVLDRQGRVLREATIGINQRNPWFERVWTAKAVHDRTIRIEGLWSTEDCTLDGRVVWEIDNLTAYYAALKSGSIARRIADLGSDVARDLPAPFGLTAEARPGWESAFQDAVKLRPELAGLGARVIYAHPFESPCAML